MLPLAQASAVLAIVAAGLMSGLFYAYSISVMWGLDRTDPRHAIESMNGINVAILNPLFLPIFLLTPVLAVAACLLFWRAGLNLPALLLGLSAFIYLMGVIGVTVTANVPMNDALARVGAVDTDLARSTWLTYSGTWTAWNHVRTLAATATLTLGAMALVVA